MAVEDIPFHRLTETRGAAAVINALEKDNLNLDVALIAPALRVEEFLHENFQKLGVPFGLFHDILSRFEDRYGYEIHRDNPARLIKTLGCPLMILHDEKDHIVPFAGSAQAADSNSAISLIGTQDLGHTRILFEPETIDAVLSYLFKTESRVSNL